MIVTNARGATILNDNTTIDTEITDNMKITILGTAHPYRGGIAAFNERLAHQFQHEGHEVDIVTFTLQYPSFLFPGKTQYSADAAPSDLNITRQVNSCNPVNWISVGRSIAHRSPDLLVIGFWLPFMAPCLGTIGRIVRGNGHTRVVAVLHNLIPHEARIGDKPFAKYFCGSVDGFVTLSKSVLADIDRFDQQKPRAFSPHPIYDNFGESVSKQEACSLLGLDNTCRYLLFFGLIRDYKGLDWLLEAFARSKARDIADVRLIVAGEFYGDGGKYTTLAKTLGIEEKIVWHTEYVSDSKVRYYFGASDLVVQPYKSATQSGVTQIAYHFEKPMLVTSVGGLAEIVPHGKVGYSVAPDIDAIAEALSDFCTEKHCYQEGIRDEKKKYSWAVMSRTIEELCQKK